MRAGGDAGLAARSFEIVVVDPTQGVNLQMFSKTAWISVVFAAHFAVDSVCDWLNFTLIKMTSITLSQQNDRFFPLAPQWRALSRR